MALAGHEVDIYVLAGSDGDSDPTQLSDFTGKIGGIDSSSYSPSRNNLDKTDFKNTEGAIKRFLGIKDGTISMSGFYDPDDAGQGDIETAFEGASDGVVFVNILFNASTAKMVKCTVENFNIEFGTEDRVNLSIDLNFNGAPTDGPTS